MFGFATHFFKGLVIDQPNIHPVADIFHRLATDAVVHEFEKIFFKKNLFQTRFAPWNEGSYSTQCMVSTMLFVKGDSAVNHR